MMMIHDIRNNKVLKKKKKKKKNPTDRPSFWTPKASQPFFFLGLN